MANIKRQFKITRSEDGCWRQDLTTVIPNMTAVRRTFRELMKMGYKFENLDLIDVETGRYVSFRL